MPPPMKAHVCGKDCSTKPIRRRPSWRAQAISLVKMSRFDYVASHFTATMSAAVSASDAVRITKAIVSVT
jgi:hypothetical protein